MTAREARARIGDANEGAAFGKSLADEKAAGARFGCCGRGFAIADERDFRGASGFERRSAGDVQVAVRLPK